MEVKVLLEDTTIFNLQKFCISDKLLPPSSNKKFALINISGNRVSICQICLRKCYHQSFCNIELSASGILDSPGRLLYPVKKTVSSIKLSDINILLTPIDHVKSVMVSVVFTVPSSICKWRKQTAKLGELVKDILKLFVIKKDFLISTEVIKQLFVLDVNAILIESLGKFSIGRVVNSTKVRINRLISQTTFEQIYTSNCSLPVLGGLEKPLKALTEIANLASASKSNNGLHTYKQVLLLGPPGCGKTALVHQVARDCGLVLKTVVSSELSNPLPGEAERALREVFEECKLLAQECEGGCILLLEQVEIVCRRGWRDGSVEGHVLRLAHQLFTLLETVDKSPGLVVVGTCSQPHALDPAARRPGRFQHQIHIGVSSEEERESIVQAVANGCGLNVSESLSRLVAQWTPGFVGADLALLANNVSRQLDKLGLPSSFNVEDELLVVWRRCVGQLQPSALRGQLGVMSVGRGRGVTFSQLGGVDRLKDTLLQALEWPLTHPDAFQRMGLPAPKGVLLYGPPGCAKTSLAQAAAAATNTTFLAVSAAQIYSPYVGDSERTIAELFHRARIGAPTILFIDEIDALVGCRGHREKGTQERVLTAFLTEMDGVGVHLDSGTSQTGVVVVAATNRPDVLDPALTRPGRFDRLVYVPPPDVTHRLDILRTLTHRMPLAADVDLPLIAQQTKLYSGADLTRLCKEAGLCAMTQEGMCVTVVSQRHWQAALCAMKPSLSIEQVRRYENLSTLGS